MKFILRATAFLLGLWLLLYIANTFLVQTDTLVYLSLHELTHRDDVELAIVGSSVARNHFEPNLIKEETGLTSFNAAVTYMSLQGCNAIGKLVFKHHDPQYTVLVAEPYFFEETRESAQTQFRLMPFIKNPLERVSYYVDLCMQDDRWFDRIFLPRIYGVENLEQFTKTLRHHTDPDDYYEAQRINAQHSLHSTYQGSGYMYPNGTISREELMRLAPYHSGVLGADELPEYSKEAILRFAKLCEKNDSQLMVVIFPFITSILFSEPSFPDYNELLAAFCEENGIPCFDLTLAKDELLPPLDVYYQNIEHMSIEGTTAITNAFTQIFNRHYAGEDLSDLFYKDYDEFFSTIDAVVNTWIIVDDETGEYIAESNHTDHIVPEYRFTAISKDGSETLLRDYSPNPRYSSELPKDSYLRVYTRAQGTDHEPVYFDRN